MNGRMGDLGLNSLYTYRCLILYCACLYIGWLLNMLTVQADFVPRRHNRPLDVGGGPNGFSEMRVYSFLLLVKDCEGCPI